MIRRHGQCLLGWDLSGSINHVGRILLLIVVLMENKSKILGGMDRQSLPTDLAPWCIWAHSLPGAHAHLGICL